MYCLFESQLTPSIHPQIEKVYIKRYYVSMFSADQSLVENFSIPKSRGSGDFSIQFHCFAWNPETLVAEGFLDFNDQIWTTTIHDRLEEMGARSIEVMTFQNNDNSHSAASALNRVISVAKTEGFTEVARGSCNSKLADKAEELRQLEKAPANEFDEKTQAALKMSLGEIKDSMATKEGLSHLEGITQIKSDEMRTSFVEMKDKISSDYQSALVNQAVTINKHQVTISAQQDTIAKLDTHIILIDRKTMNLEKQNEGQRYIIAKLNAERDNVSKETKEKDQTILQLKTEIHGLRNQSGSPGRDSEETILNQYKEHLTILNQYNNQYKELLSQFTAGQKRKHGE
jgi:hypothetical protein